MRVSNTTVCTRLLRNTRSGPLARPPVSTSFQTRPRSNVSQPDRRKLWEKRWVVATCFLIALGANASWPYIAKDTKKKTDMNEATWSLSSLFYERPKLRLQPHTYNLLPVLETLPYPGSNVKAEHILLNLAVPLADEVSQDLGTPSVADRLRIRSLYIKEPSLVIERAYTPLYDVFPGSTSLAKPIKFDSGSKSRNLENASADLLIKRYADGELSRYLHSLSQGCWLDARGPVDTWSLKGNHGADAVVPDEIVLIVGGTGITPAFQLLTNVLGRPERTQSRKVNKDPQTPKFKLLYATPDIKNTLLLNQLHDLAQSNAEQLSVSLFLESVPRPGPLQNWNPWTTTADTSQPLICLQTAQRPGWSISKWLGASAAPSPPALVLTSLPGSSSNSNQAPIKIPVYESRITPTHISQILGSVKIKEASKSLILVCGPDGMVSYLAGPKSRDGRSQGPLQGVLANLGYTSAQVFKL